MNKIAKKVTDEMTEDEFKELVANIEQVSALGKKIKASRLTERAILILIRDSTVGLSMGDIRAVLKVLPELEQRYLKPKSKSKR